MPKFIGTKQQRVFRELLKELRIAAGITQAALAEALGKPQSYISKYESGERRLDFLEVRNLCDLLGIEVADFSKKLEQRLDES